jgi:hypothetical protein
MINKREEIKKELIKLIEEFDLNINRLDEQDIVLINRRLDEVGLIDWEIIQREDEDGTWLEVYFYCRKISKGITYNPSLEFNEDGESVELMADSIVSLDNEITEFENKIYNLPDNFESVLANNYPINTFNETVKNEIIEQFKSLFKTE